MAHYAGIGSRAVPPQTVRTITALAKRLRELRYTLRTGGAEGCDTAFEDGALFRVAPSDVSALEVFVPWRGYATPRGRSLPYHLALEDLEACERAYQIASQNHPAWDACSPAAKKLHARNVLIVLGRDLLTPVDFVVCWTRDGAECGAMTTPETGGTGHGIRVSSSHGIPVFNMYRDDALARLGRFLASKTAEET